LDAYANERFSIRRRYKLMLKGDGSFQILKTINENAYKVDLSSDYGVSAIFNVSNISLFDVDDESRSNPFKER